MTRKDYVRIAEALHNAKPHLGELYGPEGRAWLAAVCSVADALGNDNERFDGDRFLRACGVDDGYPAQTSYPESRLA